MCNEGNGAVYNRFLFLLLEVTKVRKQKKACLDSFKKKYEIIWTRDGSVALSVGLSVHRFHGPERIKLIEIGDPLN